MLIVILPVVNHLLSNDDEICVCVCAPYARGGAAV